MCNCYKDCDDHSDELSILCDGCSSRKLFKCFVDGKEICLANGRKCDGIVQCSSEEFACHDGTRCIPKSKVCNGYIECTDGSDTSAAQCKFKDSLDSPYNLRNPSPPSRNHRVETCIVLECGCTADNMVVLCRYFRSSMVTFKWHTVGRWDGRR